MKVIFSYHETNLTEPAAYLQETNSGKFDVLPEIGEHLFYQNQLWRVINFYYDMSERQVIKTFLCQRI